MRKMISLLGVCLLALVMSFPAFAAPLPTQPIAVYINGSKVSFAAGTPYLQNGSVMVPFRGVFQKLGLEVSWDPGSGTVTGKGPDLHISLKVGSNRVTINGIVKKMNAVPVAINGTLYIPLRLIADATGGTASWNSTQRTVKIATPASQSGKETAVTALIYLMNQYLNEENVSSYSSLLDPDSTSDEDISDLEDMFRLYDLEYTIDSIEIMDLSPNEATVYTVEKCRRTGGAYLPDQQEEYIYTMVRKNGNWKITGIKMQNSTLLLTREEAMKPAEILPTEAKTIRDLITKYYQSWNDKNPDGVLSVFRSYNKDDEAARRAEITDFFNSNDTTMLVDLDNIYYYSGNDAAIYVEIQATGTNMSWTYTNGVVIILSKIDDTWAIENMHTLFSNPIKKS